MQGKNPIDIIRESSGHTCVGTPEDGAIIEMKEIGGRLIVIKEYSIYEIIFADKIDTQRLNINLPTTISKLIINKGIESEIVGKTFLTAKTIFNKDFINDINCDVVLSLCVDLLSELSILEKEISDYLEEEDKVCNQFKKE